MTFETLNLGNDENPCLIKICSTLKEKKKKKRKKKDLKDLKELLTKFQEVLAWSYEDMPCINLEIAKHHIDTHAHMVPSKKK